MKSQLLAVTIACTAAMTTTAQAGFLDYYDASGATEVARWEFGPGQYTDFPPAGVVIDDVVGGNSTIYNQDGAQAGPYNLPSGGALNASDGRYYYAYPTGQGDSSELKSAIESAIDPSFSFYMRYKFDAASERYFNLITKGDVSAWMFHNGNGGGLEMRVTATNGNLNRVVSDITSSTFSDGYHDILVTYDGTSGRIGIYADGVDHGVTFADGNGSGVNPTGLNFYLFGVAYGGGSVDGPGTPAAYNLMVDEARVYDGLVSVVPEPASAWLLTLGLAPLAISAMRRRGQGSRR